MRRLLVIPPKVGLWTVLERVPGRGKAVYRCRCECGAERNFSSTALAYGEPRGCAKCAPVPRTTAATHDGIGMTHSEIGARLGISKQRVEQIERVALLKLRRSMSEDFR